MKKLIINEKFINLLEKNGIGEKYAGESEILYGDWRGLDISKFRFFLHKIVDLENYEDREILHNEIHNNNFTALIMKDVIKLIEKES